MTRIKRIYLIIIVSFLISTLALTVWYQIYKQRLTDQPPFFDLFIAEVFFEEHDGSPFDIVSENQKRKVEWILDPSQFEKLDTLVIALTNISGEKFYYSSWGAPLTRLRSDYIVYKGNQVDTIPFGGHGCYTGVYVVPITNKETITSTIYNPLMFNPYSNHTLEIESDSFPHQFKDIYGDSVAIKFSQATYSTPWSKYKSQMIFSDYIVVSTNKILDNWKKGKYARLPKSETSLEDYSEIKNYEQE